MQIVFERKSQISPKVSIILLDWSCRESFHILDYMNKQTVPREQYEIIWIEYYNRHSKEIENKIKECEKLGKPPILDKWIVMDMPRNIYYHKHLMYNIGIIASRGKIIVICDSDTIAKPTFVESIIKAFEDNSNIVLHMDEVRNVSKKFYPFNYPSIEDITGKSCINFKDGKTTGLLYKNDVLHTRNYGACMSALRKDLVNIGGADEHIDYLGHICGPYEMTFRLINAGKKELWHQDEFLYHTWHPGTDGVKNYMGPHDGMNMSSLAIDIINSKRKFPLVENPAIRELRLNESSTKHASNLLSQVLPGSEIIMRWKHRKFRHSLMSLRNLCNRIRRKLSYSIKYFVTFLSLYRVILFLILKQLYYKIKGRFKNKDDAMERSVLFNLRISFVFFWRMWKNNIFTVSLCRQTIDRLCLEGAQEVAIYGTGYVVRFLYLLIKEAPLSLSGIYTVHNQQSKAPKYKIFPAELLKGYSEKVIIASFDKITAKVEELKELGVDKKNIVRLM